MTTQETVDAATQGKLWASTQWADDLYHGRRSIPFAKQAVRWLVIAALALLVSALALLIRGVNPGTDFHGGTQFVVSDVQGTNTGEVLAAIRSHANLPEVQVTQLNEVDFTIRTVGIPANEVETLSAGLQESLQITSEQIVATDFGPSWGSAETLTALAGTAVASVLAVLVIGLYLKSWRMGLSALVGLVFDVIVVLGILAIFGWEFTIGSLVAMLIVVVFSLADKLVILEKLREQTKDMETQFQSTYKEKATLGLNQMVTRSLSLLGVLVLPLIAVLVASFLPGGPVALRGPSLVLVLGMTTVLASSLFVTGTVSTLLTARNPVFSMHNATVLKRREKQGKEENKETSSQSQLAAEVKSDEVNGSLTAAHLRPGGHRGTSQQPKRTSKAQRAKNSN